MEQKVDKTGTIFLISASDMYNPRHNIISRELRLLKVNGRCETPRGNSTKCIQSMGWKKEEQEGLTL